MPNPDGSMNADDFRLGNEDRTILDPSADGQASDDSASQTPSFITDPALRDLASKSSGQSDSAPQNADSGDDRYRHMQSRADKAQRLADERAAQLAELQAQLRLQQPIVEMLQSDEELQRILDAKLGGTRGPAMPQAPKAPEAPPGYNEAEAYTNPQSESYRYRKAQEKYLLDRQDYLENLYAQQQKFYTEQQRQLQRRQQEAQRVREVHAELVRDYQFTPVEAQEFVELMTSQESLATENLVRYFRFLKNNPLPKAGGPPPPTGGTGRGAVPTPDEMFNRHIRETASARRR